MKEQADVVYWKEEQRVGNPHYWIDDIEGVMTRRQLYSKIHNIANTLREKYGLEWRDSETLWDLKNGRFHIEISIRHQHSSPRKKRVHINVFDSGRALFEELIEELNAREIEENPSAH